MDARQSVIQALLSMMRRPPMPPAQPMYRYGINIAPHPQQEPRPPYPQSGGVRG